MSTESKRINQQHPPSSSSSTSSISRSGNSSSNKSKIKKDTGIVRSAIDQYRHLSEKTKGGGAVAVETKQDQSQKMDSFTRGIEFYEKKQYPQAINCFTDALQMASNRVKVYFHRGNAYLAAQRYALAITDFTYVIQMTPKNASLFAKRGKAHEMLKHSSPAIADYTEALALLEARHSNTSSTSNTTAYEVALFNGTSDSSSFPGTSFGSSSGGTNTQRASLYVSRARVLCQMNNLSRALEDFCAAEKEDDRLEEIYKRRSDIYLKLNQKSRALQDLNRFLTLQEEKQFPTATSPTTSLYATLASVNSGKNKPDRRDTANGWDPEVYLKRAALLMRIAEEEETNYLSTSIDQQQQQEPSSGLEEGQQQKNQPKRGRHHEYHHHQLHRGLVAFACEYARTLVNQAIMDYTRILEADPEDVEALKLRAEAYVKQGEHSRASKDLYQALLIDPGNYEIGVVQAKIFAGQQEFTLAIEEMTRILETNGFFVDGLFFRAQLLEDAERYEEAIVDYSSIVNVQLDVTLTSSSGNNSQSSSNSFSNYRGSNSNSGSSGGSGSSGVGKITSEKGIQALLMRARVYMRHLNQFDEATKDYERILASFPNHLEAQLEKQEVEERKEKASHDRAQEAYRWLIEQAEEGEGTGTGTSGGGGGQNPSGRKKNKKKKKQQQKQQSVPPSIPVQPSTSDTSTTTSDKTKEGEEDTTIGVVVIEREEQDEEELDESGNGEEWVHATSRKKKNKSVVDQKSSSKAKAKSTTGKKKGLATTVTRDEACESMFESEVVQTENNSSTQAGGVESSASSDKDAIGDEDSEDQQVEEADKAGGENDEDAEDDETVDQEEESTATDDTDVLQAAAAAAAQVLIDEKYLKKRKKQLEKIRSDLLQYMDEKNEELIMEVLDRVERKKMTSQLQQEVDEAKLVLTQMQNQGQSADSVEQQTDIEVSDTVSSVTPPSSTTTRLSPHSTLRIDTTLRLGSSSSSFHHRPVNETMVDSPSRTPPLFNRRPLDYGSALNNARAAHQHQLTQPTFVAEEKKRMKEMDALKEAHAKEIDEKNAEIEALKRVLAEQKTAKNTSTESTGTKTNARESTITLPTTNEETAPISRTNGFDELRRTLKQAWTNGFTCPAFGRVDELLGWLGPTEESQQVRLKVLKYLQGVLESHFQRPVSIVPTGSFPMKTYLPNADIDVCLVVPLDVEPTWHLAVTQALCLAATSDMTASVAGPATPTNGAPFNGNLSSPLRGANHGAKSGLSDVNLASCTVRNVSFINAEVRVVKCTIDNVAVDLTANRFGAMGALLLLDEMDRRVGRGHLFKKSLMLIKAWCTHESGTYFPLTSSGAQNILGASNGALSTYALNTMVMAMFNRLYGQIHHPLQALFVFLDIFADFDWQNQALSICGPIPLSSVMTGAYTNVGTLGEKYVATLPQPHKTLMNRKGLENIRSKIAHLSPPPTSVVVGTTKALATTTTAPSVSSVPGPTSSIDPTTTVGATALSVGDIASSRVIFAPPVPVLTHHAGSTTVLLPFQIRVCNVVDPLNEGNNLARSVTPDCLPKIKQALILGRRRLCELLLVGKTVQEPSEDVFLLNGTSVSSWEEILDQISVNELDAFFINCWTSYGKGDGWRPDLLVHPRQIWHGKYTSPWKRPNEKKALWQSMLPEFLLSTPSPYGHISSSRQNSQKASKHLLQQQQQ